MIELEELQIVALDMGELKFFIERMFDTKDLLYVGLFMEVGFQLYVSGVSSKINYPVRIITKVVDIGMSINESRKIAEEKKNELIKWLIGKGYSVIRGD